LFGQQDNRRALSRKVLAGDADRTDRFFEPDSREHNADRSAEDGLVRAAPSEGMTGLFDDPDKLIRGDSSCFHAATLSRIRHIGNFHTLCSKAA
jgi:hypothetical protein